jgi:meiotically up-regulated gene 157 (Mug157) protein
VEAILDVWETEQRHFEFSPYTIERDSDHSSPRRCNARDAGRPRIYRMTWSGFRPSDDACTYHYLVPSNLLACSALEQLAASEKAGAGQRTHESARGADPAGHPTIRRHAGRVRQRHITPTRRT